MVATSVERKARKTCFLGQAAFTKLMISKEANQIDSERFEQHGTCTPARKTMLKNTRRRWSCPSATNF